VLQPFVASEKYVENVRDHLSTPRLIVLDSGFKQLERCLPSETQTKLWHGDTAGGFVHKFYSFAREKRARWGHSLVASDVIQIRVSNGARMEMVIWSYFLGCL